MAVEPTIKSHLQGPLAEVVIATMARGGWRVLVRLGNEGWESEASHADGRAYAVTAANRARSLILLYGKIVDG